VHAHAWFDDHVAKCTVIAFIPSNVLVEFIDTEDSTSLQM